MVEVTHHSTRLCFARQGLHGAIVLLIVVLPTESQQQLLTLWQLFPLLLFRYTLLDQLRSTTHLVLSEDHQLVAARFPSALALHKRLAFGGLSLLVIVWTSQLNHDGLESYIVTSYCRPLKLVETQGIEPL